VSPEVAAHGSAFAGYARETSPLQTARLVPGDLLYVPARWWHMALCEVDALSISVGVARTPQLLPAQN
jgi:ribosomal protein L16 Arg81 hydroxylase